MLKLFFWTVRLEENISQIFSEKSAAHKSENRENIFCRSGLRNTWNTCSQTISETVLKYFKRKNHFKVNVRLRPSNWHINKNLQKIKSILYQDSCWINRSPWKKTFLLLRTPCMTVLETVADWSWDCCCKHFGWLILSTDLKTAVVNTLCSWSQVYCCEHLAQLISRLLLRTPCTADLRTTVANTLFSWSWGTVLKFVANSLYDWSWGTDLKPVLWTKLTTCCSKGLMFLITVSRLFLGLIWILHVVLANQLLLRPVLKHCSEHHCTTDLSSWSHVVLANQLLLRHVLKHCSEHHCTTDLSNWSQPIFLFKNSWTPLFLIDWSSLVLDPCSKHLLSTCS